MCKRMVVLAIMGMTLGACGGGGSSSGDSSGSVIGLQIPNNMSVVTPAGNSSAASLKLSFRAIAKALIDENTLPATSDYKKDGTHTNVYDPATEPMQPVNMILCLMDQTKASDMVNKGAYAALVNEAKCDNSKGGNSTDQSSGAAGAATYNRWTIESTRADNSSPQYVKIWIPDNGQDPGRIQNILVNLTINEGVSASKPFGDFVLNFKGVDGSGTSTMSGTLQTRTAGAGEAKFIFYNTEDRPQDMGSGGTVQAHDVSAANVHFLTASGTQGAANTSRSETLTNGSGQHVTGSSTFQVAFDAAHFLRHGVTSELDWSGGSPFGNQPITHAGNVCTSRTDFKTNVWRYNLYYADNSTSGHTAGERVQVNSGFPFSATVGGNEVWGFVGYWGMGVPSNVDTSGITQITRKEFGSASDGQVYDVVQTPGKLIQSTKSTLALTDIAGVKFDYWDIGNNYQVEYVSGNWEKTGTWSPDHQTVTPITPVTITLSTGQFLGMWSQGLGGAVNYVGGDDHITYFKEKFVNTGSAISSLFGTDSVVQFKCYMNCLKPGLTASDFDSGSPYYSNSNDVNAPAATYSFDKTTLTLFVDGNSNGAVDAGETVAWPSGYTNSSQYNWGINSGNFVTAGTSLTDMSQLWNQDVSYRWEIGPNPWNKIFALKPHAGGSIVDFDPPLNIAYAFTVTDDANAGMADDGYPYYGQTFLLQYGGTGNLWGIPSQNQNGHYESSFTLKDGTLLGDGKYVIKAIDKEQRMNVAPGACSALSVATVATDDPLPTAGDVGTVDFVWTDKPNVTAAPAVVEGVVQQ